MANMAVHRSRVKITGNMSDGGEVVEGWRGGPLWARPFCFPFGLHQEKHDVVSLYQVSGES